MGVNRREFLKQSAFAGSFALLRGTRVDQKRRVALISWPDDVIASSKPGAWARGELEGALANRGIAVERLSAAPTSPSHDLYIVIAGAAHRSIGELFPGAGVPNTPESLALAAGNVAGKPAVLACGADARGLVYALLELADLVECSTDDVLESVRIERGITEAPANKIRAISRCFQSDVEDKPWFNDRPFWEKYLTMLAGQRFNRFALTFGLGYDFTRDITDAYFHFAYPFLVAVPGYDVRAVGLPDAERDSNLEMLRFASNAAAERGLDFQLGLWTHAYQWTDSPHANYTISGLTPENHAAYCRDALRTILEQCPAISSVVFRIHGESGIPEPSYPFWKTVFEGVPASGRRIEINLHAKGLDQQMIDIALATRMPVSVSPKSWAEHMGLPYHQADIRELEKPPKNERDRGFFALSSGSRRFMRYGYGDLLRQGRPYTVYSRMWPGTQRHLLWGDPVTAAAYGRASQFCGIAGLDIFEPLSFKGRRGSGLPGGRCAYVDDALRTQYDWEKFAYSYRLWGRHLYNPEPEAESWRRFLRKRFGEAGPAVEKALAHAGRILPLVTTAHGPSAANNMYWPEMYTNMPSVEPGAHPLYSDSLSPKVFGNASPFDPALFSRVNEFAGELLEGNPGGKHSPVQVAGWLEEMAEAALRALADAEKGVRNKQDAEFRRAAVDVRIQAALGKFFAARFRSGVLYELFAQSGDAQAVAEAVRMYRIARSAWTEAAESAKQIYAQDITYGPEPNLRGNWGDRLAGIDADIAAMEQKKGRRPEGARDYAPEQVRRAVQAALGKSAVLQSRWSHTPAHQVCKGSELPVELTLKEETAETSVRLHFRHVNQAEDYQTVDMKAAGSVFRAVIPPEYTDSAFALQYFFELRTPKTAWLLPGFDPNAPGQPYYVIPLCAAEEERAPAG